MADASLSIRIIHDRREARIMPIGELDIHSASTFAVAGQLAVAERPDRLHVDLSEVSFIDSAGARAVYALIAVAAEHGVPCSLIGREGVLERAMERPDALVVWSGSTTRRVEVPDRA